MMRVGFAGLGRMGQHMVRNLVRAGHDVTVWNRTHEVAKAMADACPCSIAETPRALAEGAEAVITMLADDAASEAVHLGPDGLFAAKGPRHFIEMGTMSPDHIAALSRALPDGATLIDAPVSGATQAAAGAQLLIMAGCTETDATPVAPLFQAMGRQTMYLGKAGSGTVMKLAVNSLIHGLNQTLAEAMTLAEAAGIKTETAFDVLQSSAAGAPMLAYRRPLYLDEAAHDVTFTVSLARKDMEVTERLAASLGTAMRQGKVTLEALQSAESAGYGHRDMAAMLDYARKETS